jgi:hypothetical protein
VRRKGRQDFFLLACADLEEVERPSQLRRDFVEFLRRDLEIAVCLNGVLWAALTPARQVTGFKV